MDDFTFTVSMRDGGQAVIKGRFQSRPDIENILSFEIATDQSCFLSVINSINSLKKYMMKEESDYEVSIL